MRGIAFFFCFVALLCMENAQGLQVDYMDGYKTHIDLRPPNDGYFSTGILKSHSGMYYPFSLNKTFNVSAPTGFSLLFSIRLIDLRPAQQDEMEIYAVNRVVKPVVFFNKKHYKDRRYYSKEDTTYFVSDGRAAVRFTTGPSFTTGYDGFELVYTVVGYGYYCTKENFRCRNGRCIGSELQCDGHNHCGDLSSLKKCDFPNTGTGRKVGISIGAIFLIVALVCGIIIIIRRSRRGTTDTQTIITSHPPPINVTPYPPPYNQPGTYYPTPPPPYSQGIRNPTYQ